MSRSRTEAWVDSRPWLKDRLWLLGFEPGKLRLTTGVKNWLLAMGLLVVALLLALSGSAAFDRGEIRLMAVYHTLALSVAFYVSLRLVPGMARATALRWFMIEFNYKLTREGIAYIVATFVIALAALNTGNNLIFIILASLIAGILVSGIASRITLSGVDLDLALPAHVFAKRPVHARFGLRNRKITLPSFSLTVSSDDPKKHKKAKKDRKNKRGWRFWRRVSSGNVADTTVATERRILDEQVYFPYIPRTRTSTQAVELTFPRRGRYAQDSFFLSSKFPFGFLLKTRKLGNPQDIVVYPPISPTEEFYEILPLMTGELESYQRGRGHDLYAIRDYQPDDSVRHVDWKATARTREMKVREFTREDERRVELVFDPWLPEQSPEWNGRFERAVTFCACLAWHFQEIDSQMKFHSPSLSTPMTASSEIIYQVLRELALVEPHIEADSNGGGAEDSFLTLLAREAGTFKVLLTARNPGSLPTSLWSSSYVVFFDSL